MPTYTTGNGDDIVTASDRDDLIKTNGGNDEIRAKRGNDVIYAGDGDDIVDAGDGNDVVYAGDGHDIVDGGNGCDLINAGDGNDTVRGGNGDDTIQGASGEDWLLGGGGDDDVDGGADFDQIDGGSGNDRLFGGTHFDVITTGTGSDLVYGGSDSDYIYAADDSTGDRLYGDGYDSLGDFLAHRPVTTVYGADQIIGGSGNDVIYGDSGTDAAAGGDDYLLGGGGNDTIYGEGGNDYVDGGEGRDTLRGGHGDDLIVGGAGADVLTGGAGRERFVWFDASESSLLAPDRITDFVRGEDRIELQQLPIGEKLAWGGTTPTAGGVWYAQLFGQTFVFVSLNDDAFPEMRINLDGRHNLTPTDFWGVVGDRPPEIFQDGNFVFEDDVDPVTGNVLANDVGEADLRVTSVSFGTTTGTLGEPLQGQYGSLVLDASGAYTYVLDNSLPVIQALAAGQVIYDNAFTYTAADAGGSSSASFGIQIIGRNDAPTASATSIVTNEDSPISGSLPAATDIEGNFVQYSLGAQAANGTAVVNIDGSFSYTPNAGFSGDDSFVFRVSDGMASNEYTVGVTVIDGNDAPFVASYGVPAGIVHTPIGPGQSADGATGMVIQPDGKILLAGQSSSPATATDFSLARYNADGTFDTAFGNGGIVITPVAIGTIGDAGTSVALQADGKILVGGFTAANGNLDFAVVRYNANGTIDTTFGGGDGIAITAVGPGAAADQALHLAVQSDGKIVLVGLTQPTSGPLTGDVAIVRYNSNGSLDATFGSAGVVITPVSPGTGADAARAVLSLSDGGILIAGSAFFAATGDDFTLLRYTATGALDTSFGGGDGIVTTSIGPFLDQARSILQQPDGRVVIAGVGTVFPNSNFALARYNADGSPDTTFGTNGVVTTAVGTGPSSGTSVALQADGKLLVAGSTTTTNVANNDFAIVRYNQNGSVDTTFGTNGIVVTSIGPGIDTPNAISVQADGKIVVGGSALSATGTTFDFALARYNADGSLDATFRAEERVTANEGAAFSYTVPADRFADPDGDALTLSATQTDGGDLPAWLTFDAGTRTLSGTAPAGSADVHVRVTATDAGGLSASYTYWIYTNAPPGAPGPSGFVTTSMSTSVTNFADQANAVVQQPDGKFLVAGFAGGPNSTTDTAVARYNADGSLDLLFGGGDGIATINVNTNPTGGTDTGRGIVVLADGRILVAGIATTPTSGNDITLSRLNADGTLDMSFGGGDGIITTAIAPLAGNDAGTGITLQADGKIIVVGTANVGPASEIAVVRYNADGSLDTTFDGDGFAIAGVGPLADEGLSVKTQLDGKIVISGYASIAGDAAFLVARFNADGSRDNTFGTNGIVTTNVGVGASPFPETAQHIAIQPDGSIVAVGWAPTPTSPSDVAVVRYTSAGVLDTTFGTGGIVRTAPGIALDFAFGVALQPDGRIVVAAGTFTASGGPDVAVLRYNTDGSLDTTFGGGDGIVTTAIGPGTSPDAGLSLVLQSDGRIVIAGYATPPAGGATDFALLRYNADGSLDATFGGMGNPTVEVGKAFSWVLPPQALTDADNDALTYTITMADGSALPPWLTFNGISKILTGTPPNGTTDLALRVTATDPWGAAARQDFVINVEDVNDAPVVMYSTQPGMVHTPIGSGASADVAGGVVVQPDGKILMAGQSSSPMTNQDITLVRYNADGSFDTTFATNGIVITPVGIAGSTDIGNSVALLPDGKVLVAGMAPAAVTSFDFTVVRYNADGSLDTTFGGGDGVAMAAIGLGSARDEALNLAVQSDGKIVVVGSTQISSGIPPPGTDIGVARFNADGSLDTTFGGGDGVVMMEIGAGTLSDAARAVVVQPDGRIVVAGNTTTAATGQDFALLRYTATGDLDTSFSGDGIVTMAVAPGSGSDVIRAIVQQPDGRIVVAGAAGSDFALARYNVDGSLDATFGPGGIVTTPLSGTEVAVGIARLPDGKLLVAGSMFAGTTTNFGVVRYNANGSVDTTFGSNGIVITSVVSSGSTAVGISVQADGKFVVGGHANSMSGPHSDFAFVRYNADGSLDQTLHAEERLAVTQGTSFAYTVPAGRFADPDLDTLTYSAAQNDGSALPSWLTFDAATATLSGIAPEGAADVHVRITATDPSGLSASDVYWLYTNSAPTVLGGPSGIVTTNVTFSDTSAAVALQADGKIVVTGTGLTATNDTPVLRYNTDGSLDLTFTGDGMTAISTTNVAGEQGRAVAVQPNGAIVVASNSGTDIAVSRLAGGFQDGSFGGGDGIVTTSISAGADTAASIALQADGRILVAGRTTSTTGDFDLMLVRYTADGTLDPTFGGGDGIVVPGFNPQADEAFSVKTQADGKIVVSGYTTLAPLEHAILVARFNSDGSLDTTFDGDGIVTTNLGLGLGGFSSSTVSLGLPAEAGQSLAIQPDGRIIVVGFGPTAAGRTEIALVRYNVDGSLDTTFGGGDGIVTTSVSAAAAPVDRGLQVALQADGNIVVGATAITTEGGSDFAVLRYDSNGSLDTTFGGDGVVTVAVAPGTGIDFLNGLAVQTDGRIVVVGSASFGAAGQDAVAVRLNSDGSLDTSFGGIGAPVANVGQPFTWTVQRFFGDADNDTLTYTMQMADGSPLPSWLMFSSVPVSSFGLSGTPPAGTGDLALRLTASDPAGASASQYFVIGVNDASAPPDDGDTFAFDDGFGSAMVTGFTAGAASGDVLDLSALTNPDWTTFNDILALTTQVGSDALIDLGNGNSITLVGVTKASLTADDFNL